MVKTLLANNARWAANKVEGDPEFFTRLVSQQTPRFLWIGCSDSRVPANELLGLAPGELFVHRNVANLAPPQDINCLSVLQFSIEVLKVEHIIVCGHYGCGGVRVAMEGKRNGLIDHWINPIRDTYDEHAKALLEISNVGARVNALCEHNVKAQVRNLCANPFVQDAWSRGQKLELHGWIYDLRDGLLQDLGTSVANAQQAARVFPGHYTALLKG